MPINALLARSPWDWGLTDLLIKYTPVTVAIITINTSSIIVTIITAIPITKP